MENLVLKNVSYEEMEKAILENIKHTYNVKLALADEIEEMDACEMPVSTFEMDDIRAEIEKLESIEIEEDVWESRYNVEIEKIEVEEDEEINKNLFDLKFEGDITELSKILVDFGCEDISFFDDIDLEEALERKILIVAANNNGTKHIKIFFETPYGMANMKVEDIKATIIKIKIILEL